MSTWCLIPSYLIALPCSALPAPPPPFAGGHGISPAYMYACVPLCYPPGSHFSPPMLLELHFVRCASSTVTIQILVATQVQQGSELAIPSDLPEPSRLKQPT